MCPSPNSTAQGGGGVNIPGTIDNVFGDIVGGNKITYGLTGKELAAALKAQGLQLRVPIPSVQAPARYLDRPELTRPLLAHLLGDQVVAGRAMISAVHGLGGIGKTTIARWLVWRPEVERRFPDGRFWVTLGKEPLDALTIINDCLDQFDPTPKTKAIVANTASARLASLLHDRSILFVIDDVWLGKSADVAKALLFASSRSRFLLTTRFPRVASDPDIGAAVFPLDEMSADQARDFVARELQRDLRPEEQTHSARLCKLVGGHPFALELAAARIREGLSWNTLLTDVNAEIAHLAVLDERSDDLIEATVVDRANEKSVRASLLLSVRYLTESGRQLFARLGTISEDATINPKMAATLWATDEESALRYLRGLSGAGILKAERGFYHIHDLMHDLARELLTAPIIPTRKLDIPGLGLTLQDAVRQLLERYRDNTNNGLWHTLPEDGYIHNHLVQHLEQVDRGNDLENLLWEETTDRKCGWYWARERLGQTSGFISDLNRIWGHADRIVADPCDGDKAEAIALQLHCSLIISSINSLSTGIPVEVLIGSVRCGLITLSTALILARHHPDAYFGALALSALASELLPEARPSVLGEALNAARSIGHATYRASALAAVASRLPPREALVVARDIDEAEGELRGKALAEVALRLPVEEALVVARGIDNASARAQALVEVASLLSAEAQPSVLGEALSVARGIDDESARAQTLATVASRLSAEAQPSVIREALNAVYSIEDALACAQALAKVASRLPPEDALVVARGIHYFEPRAQALAEIAPLLSTEAQLSVLSEALDAARRIHPAQARARVLGVVALRLPAETQPSVFGEALSIARSIEDAPVRVQALAAIALRLPAEAQPSVLSEALNAARGIDDALARAQALAEVASLLSAEAQPSVLSEALNAARSISDYFDTSQKSKAVAAVALRLPAREALVVAQSIDDERARARVLAAVASRLPVEALGEALSAARSFRYFWHASEAVAAVASRLPPRKALVVAQGIEDAQARAQALAAVALRLPAGKALVVAQGIDDDLWRARALAKVAPRLPVEAQPSVLSEALNAARGIDDALARATALTAVASRLPPEARPRVLGEALNAARVTYSDLARVDALLALAPLLPVEMQLGVFGEALNAAHCVRPAYERAGAVAEVASRLPTEEGLIVARGIDDDLWRARALAKVASRLPAEEQFNVLGEALSVARSIDSAQARATMLAAVASQLSMGPVGNFPLHQWTETVHVLATNTRSKCVADFTSLLPLIASIGGETAIRSLGRSIIFVGLW